MILPLESAINLQTLIDPFSVEWDPLVACACMSPTKNTANTPKVTTNIKPDLDSIIFPFKILRINDLKLIGQLIKKQKNCQGLLDNFINQLS